MDLNKIQVIFQDIIDFLRSFFENIRQALPKKHYGWETTTAAEKAD